MGNSIKDFENRSRLLSDDEKELIAVLSSFYTRLEELTQRYKELENKVDALTAAFGAYYLSKKNEVQQ